ncbi:MAG: hypothetical protein PHZ09_13895, partial [Eubacteriales bacterium]|nr:hypothetical protein [Eubacteriales bacterium]
RSEQHIKDLAAAGVEFVVGMSNDRPALDLFEKYGVGAIVSGIVPGWWGGDGHNAGKMAETNPLEKYDEAAAVFADHPAIWGIDTGDEPSALDFPHYGKVMNRVEQLFPNQFAYLNLYPNYASVSQNNALETVNQLGTSTYDEHIARYCECVASDYICYDFYLYSIDVTRHYENLRVVADACLKTGRSMWIVLQVNSNREAEWMSVNNLRFQAYTAMAFGAENIIWACYTAGWWHNQVVDKEGNKTEQYDKLKKVNAEIRCIAEEYMRYRRVSTHFTGFTGHADMAKVNQTPVRALNTGVFHDVKSDNGAPLVIGQMVSRAEDDAYALMICAAGDPHEKNPGTCNVVFTLPEGRAVAAVGGSGSVPVTRLANGSYSVPLSANQGILITAR